MTTVEAPPRARNPERARSVVERFVAEHGLPEPHHIDAETAVRTVYVYVASLTDLAEWAIATGNHELHVVQPPALDPMSRLVGLTNGAIRLPGLGRPVDVLHRWVVKPS